MGDGYDRFDNEGGGGGSFVMGLLTGTVLGAGLGMLFAPKAGSDTRQQISEQANTLASTATDGYRRATESAGDLANRGREIYDKAKDAVSKGAEEAQRYVRDATAGVNGEQRAAPASAGDIGARAGDSPRGFSGSAESTAFGGSRSGGSHSGSGGTP